MLSGALSDQDEDDVLAELDSIIKEQTKDSEPTSTVSEDAEINELPEVPTDEPEDVRGEVQFQKVSFVI